MEETPSQSMEFERDTSLFRGIVIPWFICLLAALFYCYDFYLRVMPSVMIEPLEQQYQIGANIIGLISAFYYYSYTPMQIPAGIIIDKYSTRFVLTFSIGLCTAGTFIFAMFTNIPAAYVGRVFMGVGSAFAFIGALKLAALWLPKKHFAMFAGVTTALGTLGAIAADTILSRLVSGLGWQHATYITAFLGLILTVLILIFIKDKPRWVPEAPKSDTSWKIIWHRVWKLLKNWRFWINGIVGCFMFVPISVFASLWGVAFLTQSFNLSETAGSTAASLIFIGTMVGSPLIGWISDRIKKRRLPMFVGIVIAFGLSMLLIYVNNLSTTIVLLLLFTLGFFASPQILVFAIAREISPPRSTGIATATTNFIVTAGGAIFQPLIGYLLQVQWQGVTTAEGTPFYSLLNYRLSLLIIPATLLLSFFLTFLIPRTKCQMLYESVEHYDLSILHKRKKAE